jgi:hypothetical protein
MTKQENSSAAESPDRIALAAQLIRCLERVFISRVRDVRWIEFLNDPLLLAGKVCIFRQHEALRGALALNESGVGHLAVGFVRPACEEYIWLSYLNSIEREKAGRLLLALNLSESARSLEAQRKFMGTDEMIEYGFPTAFLTEIESWPTKAKSMIEELAEELDWPGNKGRGRVPSVQWLARKAGSEDLYDFLYSATSRMLHFSAIEISRRTWEDDNESSVVRLDHPSYIEYRLDFALYWLVYLFTRTLAVTNAPSSFQLQESEEAEMMEILKRWSDLGKLPLITPEEMNLTLEGPFPWERE